MGKLAKLIPESSLGLVQYSGKDLINRLGHDIISNVVASILCGDNVRNLTEGLTQRRILLMNASMLMTYLSGLEKIPDFTSGLTEMVASEITTQLGANRKKYLLWLIGLTGKSVQNVIREEESFATYLTALDKNLNKIAADIDKLYGPLDIRVSNKDVETLMQWPDLLRCMLAIGAQTLTIRGSEKSMYGKLFEKFTLGSVLTLLGFEYISRDNMKNNMVFWLSERLDKRESDATALLRPGVGIRFDIGFIGAGNTEISLDKVSRFEREMERDGYKSRTTTIVLVDKIGDRSRAEGMAGNIGGYIIQMSGTYWVSRLAHTIKEIFPSYSNPLLDMPKEDSLIYIKERMQHMDLSQFLSTPVK